ncbi:MAG: ATP synthase subunit C [Oscillospiraceae bacterium]|nr:ATP synthase subunit C [Oscillospiraceae bacterium]
MFIFFMPLILLAVVVLPFISAGLKKRAGKKVNGKRVILLNIGSFFVCLVSFGVFFVLSASANAPEAAETAVQAAGGVAEGMKYLGAALSTGLATIGTGIAVGSAAPAAIGAVSEDDKNFTKALIFVVLGEGVAIYGLLISMLILFS